ncbi:putative methyltransferase C9orf114 [Anopheles marshallii]|uniref:putative methyltransferase C9orf114 n=1 Tax=Anopheles marshallii TaxID=1521116 RepID=UPI00237C4B7C|nr:putative methyltransferase C9orf114 [Anopheles marshallii]
MKINGKKRLTEREKMEKRERKRHLRQDRLLNRVKQEFETLVKERACTAKVEVIPVGEAEHVSTISIAVPGSIMDNAQSPELRTYLAGQIARAACIFQIDEVIVFDDCGLSNQVTDRLNTIQTTEGSTAARRCCIQLARILQYLECPQYLRKYFFPLHNDLKFSGLLNPLDSQHHLRQQSEFVFREGIVTNKPTKGSNAGSFVNVGLLNDVLVDKTLEPNLRVTVKMPVCADLKSKKIRAKVVPPSQPRQETGIYWGYTVRIANSLSEVFTKSPYRGGYDMTIGTSDRGTNIHDLEPRSLSYQHALIVFGGVLGLEPALENDQKLTVDSVQDLFDEFVNTVPTQGSRTIRTEEAILISMATLGDKLKPVNAPKPFTNFDAIPQSQDTGIKQYAFNEKRTKIDATGALKNAKSVANLSTRSLLPNPPTVDKYGDMSRFD